MQRLLEMSSVYTLAEMLSKMFGGKKIEEKLWTLFTIMIWQLSDLVPAYFY